MPKSPEVATIRPIITSVCPAMENTEAGRLMLPFSPIFFICQASRRTKVSLASSAGWRFTGKPGMLSQLLLPVSSLPVPSGVNRSRLINTPKASSHFQDFSVNSSMSTEDRRTYATTPSRMPAAWITIQRIPAAASMYRVAL